jgi:hypothetical protein
MLLMTQLSESSHRMGTAWGTNSPPSIQEPLLAHARLLRQNALTQVRTVREESIYLLKGDRQG